MLTCEKCKQPAKRLTEVDGKWIGHCCIPQEIWDQYPGWKERVALSNKRSEQARKNFGLAA